MNGGIKVGKIYIRDPVRPSPMKKAIDSKVEDVLERKLQDLQGKIKEYNVEDLIERAKKMLDGDLLLKFLEYFEDLIEDSTEESTGELAIKKEDVRELLEEHLIGDLLYDQRLRLIAHLEDSIIDTTEIIAEDMVKEEAHTIARKIIELIGDTLKDYHDTIKEIKEIEEYAQWGEDIYDASRAIASIMTKEVLKGLVKEIAKNIAKTLPHKIDPQELIENIGSEVIGND